MADKVFFDDLFKLEYKHDPVTNIMHRRMTQPTEDLILNRNHELRKNPGVIKDLPWGRIVGNIPLNLYYKARKKFPDIGSPDKEIRQKAIMKWLQTEDGKKCLVREKL